MKRKLLASAIAGLAALGLLAPGTAAQATPKDPQLVVGKASIASETTRGKIDIMGIWAHPDDDAGFTTPCGVWHDLYGITCGIIMATRGEGGSNSVGPEAGPDLGLRRENEDRTSHVRSGTIDIFNLDRVDFFYNTSAPLTAQVWDAEETLRRTVRILRETRPEILVGSTPSLAAGHGNHQYAQGRMIWEAAAAAADPTRFPEQLKGRDAVKPWQVKKILAGGLTTGSGGTSGPQCNIGFVPAANNPFTVVGTWTGHDSPYTWAEGNVQGQPAGTAKTWAQVGTEGGRAHPTQARSMYKALANPTCQRYGVSFSTVPMQPNSASAAGNDDAVLYGAVVPDPGGMPLGSLFSIETGDYFQAAGEPFEVTVSLTSGGRDVAGGRVSLTVPDGWTVSDPVSVKKIRKNKATRATFTVTPAADAAPTRYKLAAGFNGGRITAYNDTRIELVPGVEGRFARWGNLSEYETWAAANNAWVGGRSNALGRIGAGESITTSVVVTNRTSAEQSGSVAIAAPEGFVLDADSKPYGPLAAGDSATVDFVVTHTDPSDPGSRTVTFTAVTTSGAGTASENLTMYLVPSVVIPHLGQAPVIDGTADFDGVPISLAARWEGSECSPDGVDCGSGSVAQLGWYEDSLYAHVRVTDEAVSAAATPERCFGHWLVDSVEVLLDPRGDSDDTSTTFKLGIFPFTDDPTGANGNGVDGPCWSRDADNHQGFSTGPLADTVEDAPNAPGVEVATTLERDGLAYVDGGYEIELKIPLADLPAAVGPTSMAPTGDPATNDVDPAYLGLNVTPYDSDTQNFIGQTRNAWSAFGSQQSEPYRWGHAYLDGYTPPSDRATEAPAAIIPDTALQGVESPMTVHQSAVRGGTISGLQPSEALKVKDVDIAKDRVRVSYQSSAPGTVRVFLWKGDASYVPVWTTSCEDDTYGFEACSASDGAAPPWAPDMGGHLLGTAVAELTRAGKGTVNLDIDATTYAALAKDSQLLVSFAQATSTGEAKAVTQQKTTKFGPWPVFGTWPVPARGHKPPTSSEGGVNAWSFPILEKGKPSRR